VQANILYKADLVIQLKRRRRKRTRLQLRYAEASTMPSNIEIKAILRDREAAEAVAHGLRALGPEVIHQEDIFFRCEDARLKLRIFGPDHGELIRYKRADTTSPRISSYTIAPTSDPRALLKILTETLGQIGTVRKRRTLYIVGQTRVHLDEVEGLGNFMELEVVLRAGQSQEEGRAIAEGLLREFAIVPEELIAKPYFELLRDLLVAAEERDQYNSANAQRR
jgi:predicted adenylyl cyclase CyaB